MRVFPPEAGHVVQSDAADFPDTLGLSTLHASLSGGFSWIVQGTKELENGRWGGALLVGAWTAGKQTNNNPNKQTN